MSDRGLVAATERQLSVVEFDSRIYSIETLQKAALKFTRVASFDFRIAGEHQIQVSARSNPGLELSSDQFIDAYRNEVLDQHLRAIVSRETEAERNLILAYAFSNTKLVSS
jgi:His-Xaa-Ser system protein HxsD